MESESSSSSKNAGDSYLGSFISLISKYEIRYEGVLYCLNVQDSTIGLKNVKSYGTEGRKKDGLQIPPSDKVYEYILFRGSDIKDLQVKSSPPVHVDEQIHHDPAIIQSQYAKVPLTASSSAPVGNRTLMESNQWQDTPALTSRAYPSALPSYQSASQVSPSNHSEPGQNAGDSTFSTPLYWQGYNGKSISASQDPPAPISLQSPSTLSSPMMLHNHMQAGELQSIAVGLLNTSEPVASVASSIPPKSLYPHFTPIPPVQCSSSPDMRSSSMKGSPPSQAAYMTKRLTMPSFPSALQETNTTEAQLISKSDVDPLSVRSAHSLPIQSGPSFIGSASGPLLTPPSSLLTPDHLAQTRSHILSLTQKSYPDQKDVSVVSSVSSYTPSSNSTPASQPPLLPLPVPAQQSQFSTPQFAEEFDFEAMNEKFKKDEVWGYLGKSKQKDRTEGVDNPASDQTVGDKEGHSLPVPSTFDPKPAYKKDDFFDTISCNSHGRGSRNVQNRFSERMKLDSETFGNFHQRPHLGYGPYGGYGAGRVDNFRGPYNYGRGYGYGGRGRGGNMHI